METKTVATVIIVRKRTEEEERWQKVGHYENVEKVFRGYPFEALGSLSRIINSSPCYLCLQVMSFLQIPKSSCNRSRILEFTSRTSIAAKSVRLAWISIGYGEANNSPKKKKCSVDRLCTV